MSMSVTVNVVDEEDWSKKVGSPLLLAPMCNDAWALCPFDESDYGFYRVLNHSGYPWLAITTLHYLRQHISTFLSSPQNSVIALQAPGVREDFYLLPANTLCSVEMWDSS